MIRPGNEELEKYRVNYPADTDFAAYCRLLQSKWRARKGYKPGSYGNFLLEKDSKFHKYNFLTDKIKELVTSAIANSPKDRSVIKEPRIWDNLQLLSLNTLCRVY